MDVPENLLYTDEHEWVKIDNAIATIGITDYAQGELGDIVFIEFPDLNSKFKKGEIMLIDDHINLLGGSPLAFKGVSQYGERFVDMSCPYDQQMTQKIESIAQKHDLKLNKGVYASVLGPQLETRAEYRMLRTMGADAVGMSTVPEIIVANHLKLPVAAVSVLTDEGDPDNLQPVNVKEIIAMAEQAEPQMIILFKDLIREIEIS